jgi:redox-sensitive bicupin YhaK (pirin superfamily)
MQSAKNLMKVLGVRTAKTTYPTGNPKFSVKQSFPAGFDEEESDPFLMCDFFGPKKSEGKASHPDQFDVPWHPHRGMDICTYLKEGVGRHADSLGNRGEYATPGMQWISVGSGVEHAEGGGTPAGEMMTGFQIWVNVPSVHKMGDPKYGTNPPDELPLLSFEGGVTARLLAGQLNGQQGPFQSKQPLQMIDFMLPVAHSTYHHQVPVELDNCLLFVYAGSGSINNQPLNTFQVIRLDASLSNTNDRNIHFTAGSEGMSVMYFSGKRLNEPIAWQGPFVMNTQEQIAKTIEECRQGKFPPRRTPFDFKKISTFPKDFPGLQDHHHSFSSPSKSEL